MTEKALAERPKPRMKRWAPKGRSGCLTCRARKIKCDETKPHCNRCKKGNFVCKGYQSQEPWPAKQQQTFIEAKIMCASPIMHPHFNSSVHVQDIFYLAPRIPTAVSRMFERDTQSLIKFQVGRKTYLQSFLGYLPQTSGYDEVLDSAVHCVAEAYREIYGALTSSNEIPNRQNSLALYTRAIRFLQKGLEDPVRSKSAEVLCATELLTYYECLGSNGTQASIQHVNGTIQLIKHRGPENFTSDFEKALIAPQVPYLVTLSLFNNTPIFLNTDAWLETCKSFIVPSDRSGDRSEMGVLHSIASVIVLAAMADATQLLKEQLDIPPSELEQRRQHLLNELDKGYEAFIEMEHWLRMHPARHVEIVTVLTKECSYCNDYEYCRRWLDLVINSWLAFALISRVRVALNSDHKQRNEVEAQRWAAQALAAHQSRKQTTAWRLQGFIVEPVCKSILETKTEWVAQAESEGVASIEVHAGWISRFGLKM